MTTATSQPDANEKLMDKLSKILALTNSPVEGEAANAAAMLQKLLSQHNLSMADLERRGSATAPSVTKDSHDLGKAAFTWKLDLADAIAKHYYCHPLVDRRQKTVAFVGRPENVEALQMLYAWIIDQIKRISADARRQHQAETGEHIDPLRWQVNFGIGAVRRLGDRLDEIRQQARQNADSMALIIHHDTEISDWLEENGYYRMDGQKTKAQREAEERWRAVQAQKAADRLAMTDEEYYTKYPYERPETPEQKAAREAQQAALNAKYDKQDRARAARQQRRYEQGYPTRERRVDWNKVDQANTAARSGRNSADKINLTPFIATSDTPTKGEIR